LKQCPDNLIIIGLQEVVINQT